MHAGLELGGQRTTPYRYPETIEAARGHGLCGNEGTATGPDDPCWAGGDCPSQVCMESRFRLGN